MAARTVKIRHDEEGRFYVYKLMGDGGTVLYVGKGSGRRLQVQMSKRQCHGEIIARFKSERDAYAYEVLAIAELKPELNRHKGGNGCRAVRRVERKPKWLKEMDAIGTRAYGARLLLKFTRPNPTKRLVLEAIAYP